MRERLRVFARLLLFWIAFMIIARLSFLGYNHDLTSELTAGEFFKTMLYGLWMDGSVTGYFLALSGLLLTCSALIRGNWIYHTITITTILLVILCSILVTVDLELYRHWGFRLDTTPFFYMGSGAMGSIDLDVIIKAIVIMVLLIGSFTLGYLRLIGPSIKRFKPSGPSTAIAFFVLAALMFIPIRGSFSVAPMNTGFVYYHATKVYANHSAINVIWNFLYSIRKGTTSQYPDNFYNKTEAENIVASLYPASDTTYAMLNNKRPNVMLIIIESFTADVIEPLGGVKGVAPNLNQLCSEGILFDNFYASGDRTDKGLISILSGYPAQPSTSIIKFPAKTQRLPQLSTYMRKLGYQTSFVYGGDLDFANFRSYLAIGGFDRITTVDDFPDSLHGSKWGIQDHLMFNQVRHQLDSAHEPFFKVILTLSSHEPFDVPMETVIPGKDTESMFLNSCYYTDKSIGDFITYCKQQPWWRNTLVVMTADHGHRHPGNKELKDKRRFKTPLLMIGGAVKKDTIIHTVAGQTDIANTLLAQLDQPYPEFKFSKNIFGNNVVPFAAYFYNNGYGFILPDKYMVYDNAAKRFLINENTTAADLNTSKAYQQSLYSDYNER